MRELWRNHGVTCIESQQEPGLLISNIDDVFLPQNVFTHPLGLAHNGIVAFRCCSPASESISLSGHGGVVVLFNSRRESFYLSGAKTHTAREDGRVSHCILYLSRLIRVYCGNNSQISRGLKQHKGVFLFLCPRVYLPFFF